MKAIDSQVLYCPKCQAGADSLKPCPDEAELTGAATFDETGFDFTYLDFECENCGAIVRGVYDLARLYILETAQPRP